MKFHLAIPFFFLCSIFLPPQLSAQCGCDHILSGLSATSVNIINASSFNYSPGDVFCLEADTVAGLRFVGFQGSSAQPLVFKNCNGKVVVRETTYSGIDFNNSRYVHLTGTGDTATYGFHVIETGGGAMGVNVGNLSSDAEIDHVEIQDVGFAGIMAKTDPNCNDTATWRRNGYVLRNLHIHDNFIHDTGGEGMYLGYTGGYKVVSNKICNGDTVFGHWLENVDVHHNRLENTGWDAIQVNLVRSNGKVHDNWVHNPGTENQNFQNFAMSIGGGIYEIYNNFIYNDPGMPGKGMQMISGESGCKLYNNVFIDLESHALFLHSRHKYDDPNFGYAILNNTIVRPGASAIKYNSTITTSADTNEIGMLQDDVPVYFHNNFIASPNCDYESGNTWKKEPECYFDFNNKSTRDSQLVNIGFNMMSRRMDTLALADTTILAFWPLGPTGPLIDAGMDVTSFGVTFDHDNYPRPYNALFDIGAYEFTVILNASAPEALQVTLYPNPTSDWLAVKSVLPVAEVHVRDAMGREMGLAYEKGRLDLGELPAGVYWVEVRMENGMVEVRPVVKR